MTGDRAHSEAPRAPRPPTVGWASRPSANRSPSGGGVAVPRDARRVALAALAIVWLFGGVAHAGELDHVFEEGNHAYAEGRFSDAVTNYERLVAHGVREPAVLFNLGNALFRLDRLAEARLAWERALRRAPGDADLHDNLSLVVSRLGLEALPERSWPERMLDGLLGSLGTNGWAWLAVAAWAIAHASLAIGWATARARPVRVAALAMATGTFLLAAPLAWLGHTRESRAEAVALTGALPVLAGPRASETSLFTLPLGEKVQIEGTTGEWAHVSLPNGWHGWVALASVGRVDG